MGFEPRRSGFRACKLSHSNLVNRRVPAYTRRAAEKAGKILKALPVHKGFVTKPQKRKVARVRAYFSQASVSLSVK